MFALKKTVRNRVMILNKIAKVFLTLIALATLYLIGCSETYFGSLNNILAVNSTTL